VHVGDLGDQHGCKPSIILSVAKDLIAISIGTRVEAA
jgi:hypothetical protein